MIPLCYVCLLKYPIAICTLNRRMYGLTTINDFHLEKKKVMVCTRGVSMNIKDKHLEKRTGFHA